MRQLILDIETTGLNCEEGHRIIEIGAVELLDRQFNGNNFHRYINPERKVENEALTVHGISNDFLADKPLFFEIAEDFRKYIKGAELVIHNAPFDIGFLNYEFKRLDPKSDPIENYMEVFDTLVLARKKHPGKKNSLDALCKRYGVDNAKREFHGALLDARLLAEVFLAMTGGQMTLSLFNEANSEKITTKESVVSFTADHPNKYKIISASKEDEAAHNQMLELINKASKGKCLWGNFKIN